MEPTRPKKNNIKFSLWAIAVAYLIFVIFTGTTSVVSAGLGSVLKVCFLSAFAVMHCLTRYRIRDFAVFFGIVFITSNFFENLSIKTGFPFGSYHYTEVLGAKLFQVPLVIAPAYFVSGYLAWTLAHPLVNRWNNRLGGWDVLLIPLIASFIMVAWDVCMDPVSSTVQNQWVWQNGGAYFGVPFQNFAGWFLCVFIYNQLFTLYLLRSATRTEASRRPLPKAFWYQAVFVYVALSLSRPLLAIFGENVTVIDQSGKAWETGDIFQSMTLVTVFTMWLIALLSAVRISRNNSRDVKELVR